MMVVCPMLAAREEPLVFELQVCQCQLAEAAAFVAKVRRLQLIEGLRFAFYSLLDSLALLLGCDVSILGDNPLSPDIDYTQKTARG